MKTINQLILTFAGLLMATSFSVAQVKMGANPGTIGTNSGLEVEATNGNKTIVNKATGQVTIQDGTQGNGKVLTSDANGGSSWESGTSAFRSQLTNTQTFPGGGVTFFNINLETTLFDQDGGINLATDRFTVTKSGTYLLLGNMIFSVNTNTSASIAIFKNGSFVQNAGNLYTANTANAVSINLLDIGVVGDYYELRANVNAGAMPVTGAGFSGTRIK